MATYKKQGRKKKSRGEKIEQRSTTAKVFGRLDTTATLFEDWVARNRNFIFGVIAVIVVGVLGYLAYDNFVLQPKQEEAINEMSEPLDYFTQAMQTPPGAQQDTLLLKSLNGSGGYGLLDIISNYKGTDAANIAHYSAGMAYLKLKKYDQAIDHLKKFSGKDEFYPAMTKGAIGDAYVESGDAEQGLKYYEEAAAIRINSFTTPRFLFKAALTALSLDQNKKAEELLKKIEKDYPDSPEAVKVPVYLGLAENAQ